MPPKGAKVSADDRAKKMMERGRALREKSDHTHLSAILKLRPDIVSVVKRDLMEAGTINDNFQLLTSAPFVKVERPEDDAASTAASSSGAGAFVTPKKGEGSELGEDEDSENENDTTRIHRNYGRWQDVPPKRLVEILSACEPVSLSLGNMKSLVRRGCRQPPRSSVLELYEAMFDRDPQAQIGDDRKMIKIIENHQQLNMVQGRRLRDITLPADWSGPAGMFEKFCRPPVLYVQYRPTQMQCLIAGVHCDADSEKNITIYANFSKQRAQLVFSNGTPPMIIAMEFMRQGVSLADKPCGEAVVASTIPPFVGVGDPVVKRQRTGGEGRGVKKEEPDAEAEDTSLALAVGPNPAVKNEDEVEEEDVSKDTFGGEIGDAVAKDESEDDDEFDNDLQAALEKSLCKDESMEALHDEERTALPAIKDEYEVEGTDQTVVKEEEEEDLANAEHNFVPIAPPNQLFQPN